MAEIALEEVVVPEKVEAGLVFTARKGDIFMQGDWVVVGPGNWKIQDGEAKWLCNRRNNKWWCVPVNGEQKLVLCCFDGYHDETVWREFNFRYPTNEYDTSKP